MNSPRDLRRRIKSISSTAQITKAMQMVAASKMRKAQQAATRRGAVRAAALPHPAQRDDAGASTSRIRCSRCARCGKRAVILIAADKGLCGALNTQRVPRCGAVRSGVDGLHHRRPQGRAVRRPHAAPAGRRVRLRRLRRRSPEARAIAAFARDLFLKGEVDRGADRRDALRQHADAGAGRARVPAGRRDHGPAGRRRRRRGGAAGRRSTSRCSSRTPRTCSATCWRTT